MSSLTPFFSITESSSFCTSSKVKPYWNPEQPPPVTNTRSLSSGLPSSSMSCLTLLAAPSLKDSGTGISATAFIHSLPGLLRKLFLIGRRELELDAFHLGGMVHQSPFNHGARMDFDGLVVHIPFDLRPRL